MEPKAIRPVTTIPKGRPTSSLEKLPRLLPGNFIASHAHAAPRRHPARVAKMAEIQASCLASPVVTTGKRTNTAEILTRINVNMSWRSFILEFIERRSPYRIFWGLSVWVARPSIFCLGCQAAARQDAAHTGQGSVS